MFDTSVGGDDKKVFFDTVTDVTILVPIAVLVAIIAVVDGRWRRWVWRRRWVVVTRGSVIHRRRHIISATRRNRSAYAETDKTSDDRCTRRVAAAVMVAIVMPVLSVGDRRYC
jgi:hypothetical protein